MDEFSIAWAQISRMASHQLPSFWPAKVCTVSLYDLHLKGNLSQCFPFQKKWKFSQITALSVSLTDYILRAAEAGTKQMTFVIPQERHYAAKG